MDSTFGLKSWSVGQMRKMAQDNKPQPKYEVGDKVIVKGVGECVVTLHPTPTSYYVKYLRNTPIYIEENQIIRKS